MAQLLPTVDPATIPHDSERLVYQALLKLPPGFIILHSYPWLKPDPMGQGDALREGEADFVILHRELGLLVLEVKGGEELVLQNRQWSRKLSGGRLKPIKDPFQQAQRSMHALLNVVEARTGGIVTKQHITYGYAAVFPHQVTTGQLPLDADHRIIMTGPDMGMLAQRIPEAFRAFGRKPALSEQDFRLVCDALLPRFRVYRPLGADIETDAQRLIDLTESQQQALEGLYNHPRVLIEGAAGTGKTILALERALAFARQGKPTLFVCYSRELALWAQEQLEHDKARQPLLKDLQVRHFHGLAIDLAREAGVEFTIPKSAVEAADFWREEAPELLEQAVSLLPQKHRSLGALVVDEAQDFHESWWYSLLELLEDQDTTPIYVFMDRHQSLFGPQPPPPFALPTHFNLLTNCRNTRRIATASARLLPLPVHVLRTAPIGIEPRVMNAPSQAQQRGLVQTEVRRLLQEEHLKPSQIVLLGPASWEHGSLKGVRDIEGVPLTSSAVEWRQGKGLLCTTARTFKGLEADVVVLYDVGSMGSLFTMADLYVACTRARHHLTAIVHDAGTRRTLEAAAAAIGAS